jgi:hypothetical protein
MSKWMCLVAACIVVACAQNGKAGQRPDLLDEPTVLLAGSENVKTSDDYNGAISYTIAAEYPASDVMQRLDQNLRAKGFVPLNEEVIFNATPTSVRSWAFVTAAGVESWVWNGEWRRQDGTVYSVRLRFAGRSASGEPRPNGKLNIGVVAYSQSTVDALKAAMK